MFKNYLIQCLNLIANNILSPIRMKISLQLLARKYLMDALEDFAAGKILKNIIYSQLFEFCNLLYSMFYLPMFCIYSPSLGHCLYVLSTSLVK